MKPPLGTSWNPPALALLGMLGAAPQVACQTAAVRPADAAAQTPSAGDTLSAAILKRVGDAVDGYRTGETVWVVVSFTPPHRVDTVVASLEVANRRRATLGRDYHVLGPYRTATDYNAGQPPMFFFFCHDWDSDPCNFEYALETPAWDYGATDSIVVSVYRAGDTWRRQFPRGSVDALFFTLAAADKFYFPYLAQVHGLGFADSVRVSLRARLRTR